MLWELVRKVRAIAGIDKIPEVMQAMNDAAFAIKPAGDCGKKLAATVFVFPPPTGSLPNRISVELKRSRRRIVKAVGYICGKIVQFDLKPTSLAFEYGHAR